MVYLILSFSSLFAQVYVEKNTKEINTSFESRSNNIVSHAQFNNQKNEPEEFEFKKVFTAILDKYVSVDDTILIINNAFSYLVNVEIIPTVQQLYSVYIVETAGEFSNNFIKEINTLFDTKMSLPYQHSSKIEQPYTSDNENKDSE